MAGNQCELILNAPSASHAGWELQLCTIGNKLDFTLSQSLGKLDDASLRIFFYEAMAIINSCLLTLKGINDLGYFKPLTPNYFVSFNYAT